MDILVKNLSAVLFDEVAIRTQIKELGFRISKDYLDKDPIMICILKGAVVFFSDLIRYMTIPMQMDFMSVSSYGYGATSSQNIAVRHDITIDVTDRHIIVVEDIVDTGYSIKFIYEHLLTKNPASIHSCVLLNKQAARKVEFDIKYVCFEIENDFVIGYGLDFAEQYRNLPYIGILKEEAYK
jgi:hypoxanthine phosphoribosyltransferase